MLFVSARMASFLDENKSRSTVSDEKISAIELDEMMATSGFPRENKPHVRCLVRGGSRKVVRHSRESIVPLIKPLEICSKADKEHNVVQ